MARFFRNLFGTNDEYDTYTEAVNRGGVVVSVTADESRLDRAVDIMNSNGAVDIDHRRESWGNTAIGTPSRTDTTTNTTGAKATNTSGAMSDRTIPVVKEELQVGKRSVSRGGVRVISRIVEQPVQEEVTLREERVKVDRRPANRAATEQDLRRRDEVIEVRETVEEPVVGKRSRVVEEVVVSKETAQRQETVRDTVRRSDVSVERLGPEGGAETDYNAEFRRDFQSAMSSTTPTLITSFFSGIIHIQP